MSWLSVKPRTEEEKINRFVFWLFIAGMLAIFLFLGFTAYNAHADILQSTHDTQMNPDHGWVQSLGTGISGTMTNLKFWCLTPGSGQCNSGIYMYETEEEWNSGTLGAWIGSYGGTETFIDTNGYASGGIVDRSSLSYSFNPAKYYYIAYPSTGQKIYGSTSNLYSNGCIMNSDEGSQGCVAFTIVDMGFEITGAGTETTNVSLTFPTASTTQDFSNFEIDGELLSPYAAQNVFCGFVDYGTSTSTWQYTDYFCEVYPEATTDPDPMPIPKTHTLNFGQTYYAQARLKIGGVNDTQVATSSIVSFSIGTAGFIDNSYLTDYASSSLSTSTIGDVQTCNPDDPWYQYGFCSVLTFLFVPDNLESTFSDIRENLSTKAPLGYYYIIRSKFQEFENVDSTSTPSLIASIDFGGVQKEFKVLDFSDTEDIVGVGSYQILYDVMYYMIWLSLAFYLIVRGISFWTKRHTPYQQTLF